MLLFYRPNFKFYCMILKTNNANKGPIATKGFIFAVKIVRTAKRLFEEREFVMSKQVLRSGTAIGAISREAKNAESTKDFIHKLAMAQKEADETGFWLDLLYETDYLCQKEYKDLRSNSDELMRMITSAIVTSKKKLLVKSNSKLKT